MTASYLVLDIETVLDPSLPLPQQVDGAALPPSPYHQVCVLGVAWLDERYHVQRIGVIGENKSESGILEDFAKFLVEKKPTLVTWNGRGFDMPVIAARCLKHGIVLSHYYSSRDVRYRFSPDGHLDLMDYLSDFGAARPAKLDLVAQLIGLPGKIGVDGKDVGPMIFAGKLAEVQAYCLSDVIQTAGIFLRAQLVRGVLPREGYRAAMQVLLDRAAADPRVSIVNEKSDKKRLLLD